jgi:hypothetical protein
LLAAAAVTADTFFFAAGFFLVARIAIAVA